MPILTLLLTLSVKVIRAADQRLWDSMTNSMDKLPTSPDFSFTLSDVQILIAIWNIVFQTQAKTPSLILHPCTLIPNQTLESLRPPDSLLLAAAIGTCT